MDRRDALKKLGMGGATAVGAAMVMSSPAFATTTAGGVTASANRTSKKLVTVVITQAPAGCTGSQSSRTVDWTYSVSGAEITNTGTVNGTQVGEAAVVVTLPLDSTSSAPSGNFSDSTTITVSATSTYECVGSGNASLEETTSRIFTYSDAGNGSWSPAGTVALV